MHPVKSHRKVAKLSVKQLAEMTGLAESTIHGIEEGTSEYKTNHGVARILAEFFGCKVKDLFEPTELSHLGRPPLTGHSIKVTVTIEMSVSTLCPDCFLELSITGICANCD